MIGWRHLTGAPEVFIRIIINWYSKLSVRVKWDEYLSSSLLVTSGVRQGGLLSPLLFNCYVNDILVTLRQGECGCRLNSVYTGCIMYADDLILISASVLELQVMLDICSAEGRKISIKFNSSKSNCIMVGPMKKMVPSPMSIDGQPMLWVQKMKYLGIWIVSGSRFEIDLSETRRSFFASVNNILSKTKFSSDLVKLRMVESHCLPILLYAIESKNLNIKQLKLLNSWWNSVYRKIFGYHKWESARTVICLLGRLDIIHLENMRRLMFFKRASVDVNANATVLGIMRVFVKGREFRSVVEKFSSQWHWSQSKIKAMMFVCFKFECQPVD